MLIILVSNDESKTLNSKDFFKHSIIKSNIYNKLKKHKLIPTSKNKPTEKDYERGNYKRYFAKRITAKFGLIEINKKIQHIERKLDSSLQTSSELEVKHRRSVNFKLLLLLALWILDKFVLFIFFRYLNVS